MPVCKHSVQVKHNNVKDDMRCDARKPDFFLGENKGTDQLCSNCTADLQLISAFVFATRIVQFLFYLNPKFQVSVFIDCTGRFVSDLVRNPKDQFSRIMAHRFWIRMSVYTHLLKIRLSHTFPSSASVLFAVPYLFIAP